MKYFLLLLISLIIVSVSNAQNYYDTTECPALAFSNFHAKFNSSIGSGDECFDGTIIFESPIFCDLQTEWPYQTNFSWTLDSVLWNFGDGSVEISVANQDISHQYSSFGSYIVTAMGFFTGTNGEQCESSALSPYWPNVLNGEYILQDACEIVDSVNQVFVPSIEVVPFLVEIDLYTEIANRCDSSAVEIFYEDITFQQPDHDPFSYYELLIDGQVVLSNITLSSSGASLGSYWLLDGDHLIELNFMDSVAYPCSISVSELITIDPCIDTCLSCNTFKPKPGERYWVSAWVKESQVSQFKTYINSSLEFGFTGSGQPSVEFLPSGDIIEGWQRIVGSFTIPNGTTELDIKLVNDNSSIDAYFDDIRIHPFNASMKSYVYDPETFWLTAELDDNNYATFYEYDNEGQLVRIKKETARGIMTIQESRSANPKSE